MSGSGNFGRMTQSRRKMMELRKEGITKKTLKKRVATLIVATLFISFIVFALTSLLLPTWVGIIAAVAVALANVVPASFKIWKKRNELKLLEDKNL